MSTSKRKIALIAAVASCILSACGAADTPTSDAAAANAPTISRNEIIAYALTGIGSPYVFGGTQWDPKRRKWKGPDCSSFVAKAWALPKKMDPKDYTPHLWTTAEFKKERKYWTDANRKTLKPGDALVYRSGGAGHIVLFSSYDSNGNYRTLEAKGRAYGVVKGTRSLAKSKSYIGIQRRGIGTASSSGSSSTDTLGGGSNSNTGSSTTPNGGGTTPVTEPATGGTDQVGSGNGSNDMVPFATGLSCGSKSWPSDWSQYVASGLDDFGSRLMAGDLARNDIKAMCPGYFRATTEQRKAFWTLFIASMACPESGYNPKAIHREPAPLNLDSIGLLQLSYEDRAGHKRCELNRSAKNATDPRANLRCGVAILDDELKRLGSLFNSKSYWAVLRPKKAAKTKAQYNRYKDQLSFCQNEEY